MRIAINTRFLLSHKMEGFGWYTYEVVKRLVANHPDHEFIFFFDRKYDSKFIFGPNVTPVVLSPQARHPFLFYWWFEFSVAKALKKYKADLFFSPDGYLSLRSSVKQVAVIHDINFEHNPKDLKWLMRKYYTHFFPKFAKKATHIVTVSNYSKKDIVSTYGISPEKITAIWNGASDVFKPIDEIKKQEIRTVYAEGMPYLLFVGALHPRKNVGRLLQAFEIVKDKYPEIPHELVIVGTELWSNANGSSTITERTKKHVHFTGHLHIEKLAEVMAGADIFTYVPYFEGFGIPLIEAMKSGTPILSGNLTSLPEVAGEAALYCDPLDVEDIASKLVQLIQDPHLQDELRQKGLERAKLFSWDQSAMNVWEEINRILTVQ